MMTIDSVFYTMYSQVDTRSAALLSSVGGFDTSNVLGTISVGSDGTTSTTVSLSGASWEDLTTSVEFRVYFYGFEEGYKSMGIGRYTGNDLVVNGSSALVPEPATVVLLAIGGIGAVLSRRRKR